MKSASKIGGFIILFMCFYLTVKTENIGFEAMKWGIGGFLLLVVPKTAMTLLKEVLPDYFKKRVGKK